MSYRQNGRLNGTTAYQLKYGPDPKSEYIQTFDGLYGGLNVHDVEYRLANNESPEMRNMKWVDGMLASRDGQTYIDDSVSRPTQGSDGEVCSAHNCYENIVWDRIFAHIGTGLYCMDPAVGVWVSLDVTVPEVRGTFARYDEDTLLYKTEGAYIQITRTVTQQGGNTRDTITASPVQAYVPVTALNCDAATGAGDTYQPVNRLTTAQTRKYNITPGAVVYHLTGVPWVEGDAVVTSVKVGGAVLTSGFSVVRSSEGYDVAFTVAPTAANTNNAVEITFNYAHSTNYQSIDSCRHMTVFGGNRDICVVMGGCSLQPNAYFWSSNDSIRMNPGYFPDIYYNFAGDNTEPITGFGKQQGFLVIFKRNSVGRAQYGIIDYVNGLVNDGTISTESANYMFTKAYESYRLKDSEGNRTDEYDWSKLNDLPWN